jgi:hypothetical protein
LEIAELKVSSKFQDFCNNFYGQFKVKIADEITAILVKFNTTEEKAQMEKKEVRNNLMSLIFSKKIF